MWQALKSWLSAPVHAVEVGTVKDLSAYLQRLLEAPQGSFLIVGVTGLDDDDAFLQFAAGPNDIQIDHPLKTANQLERESALRAVFAAAGLTPYETRGSDGARFLDCDVPRDSAGAAILVQRIFESVFGIDSSTELRFVGNRLPPAP